MGYDFKLRMITLHLDCRRLNDPMSALEEYSTLLAQAADTVYAEIQLPVWSRRIVLDYCDKDTAMDIIENYTLDETLVSLGNYEAQAIDADFLDRLTEEGFFAAILLKKGSWEEARHVSRLIHALTESDPSKATRIGVNVLGTRIDTPYFPLAATKEHLRATAGLLYPNYLLGEYRRDEMDGLIRGIEEAARKAEEGLKIAANILKVESAGVDLSVSPWMEESSLGLIEYVAGVRLPEAGFAHGLALVNKAVGMVASNMETVGFNEVQLPVAEDAKLKARVSELETTARDLARLSGVCLAGLDLAVVPANIDYVAGILLETRGYSLAKGRPLGVRIIPVEDVEPGDKVYLDKFGETPVMKP